MKRFRYLVFVLLALPSLIFAAAKPEVFVTSSSGGLVRTFAFSQDGRVLALGGEKEIKLWDTVSRREIRTIGGSFESVSLSPDGRMLASGGNNMVKLWDATSGREIRTLEHQNWAGNHIIVAFSPDGQLLASANIYDAWIKLWDVSSGREVGKLENEWANRFDSISFSPDGHLLAATTHSEIGLWDIASARQIRKLEDYAGPHHVAFSSNGRLLAWVSGDKSIKLWDFESGREIRSLLHDSSVLGFAFSPDGRVLALLDVGEIKLLDTANGSAIGILKKSWGYQQEIAFSPDGRVLAAIDDNKIKFWDTTSVSEIREIGALDSSEKVSSLTISPNGHMLASGSPDGSIRLWDATSGRQIRTLKGHRESASYPSVDDLCFSAGGRVLVSQCRDGTIKLWDTAIGQEIRTLNPGRHSITLSCSPDGRIFATSHEYEIKLWDVSSGNEISTIATSGSSWGLSFSPDGRMLASGQGGGGGSIGEINLYDVKNGAYRGELEVNGRVSFVFSPNGRMLSAGDQLWDVDRRRELRRINSQGEGVSSIVFSHNSRLLTSASGDNIKLWDVESGKLFRTFNIDSSGPIAAFPSNGVLAIGGNAIRIWDSNTGTERVKLISLTDGGWVAITPEGYYDASPGADKYINVRIGNKVYGIDQYRSRFYRPMIVQAALAGKPITDLANIANVKPAPSVAIVDTPSMVDKEEVRVRVHVTDQGGGIGDVRFYLNGTLVGQARGRDILLKSNTDTSKGHTLTYKLKLVAGKNALQVIAFNAENSMQSIEAVHTIKARITDFLPTLHALIIGIDEYDNPKYKLQYAGADAVLIEKTLNDNAAKFYTNRIRIQRLTTRPETTKDVILAALKGYRTQVKPNDVFLFFIASHGTIDHGEFYLITSNVDSVSSHILRASALSQKDITSAIANIPATKKIVFIDSCNSGKLGDAIQVALLTRGLSEETALKLLGEAVGSVLLSAATSQQQAIEGYKSHGLFTYVVTEGMKGAADENRDGFVWTNELVGYVDSQVRSISESHFGQKQSPTTGLTGIFPLTKTH